MQKWMYGMLLVVFDSHTEAWFFFFLLLVFDLARRILKKDPLLSSSNFKFESINKSRASI